MNDSETLRLTGTNAERDVVAESIALLRRAERLALTYDPENGFWLAFSGGKDSQALYHVAKMAGVRFKAFMSPTTVDPPEVLRFVRKNYPDVEIIKPNMSIYMAARRRKIVPTRMARWCCEDFKEIHGAGKVTLVGVRREESFRRSKRNELELGGHRFSGTLDQFEEHTNTMVSCINGKDKVIVSPLLDWTEKDVWRFLNSNGIGHCELYDQGVSRIGCILCPMKTTREKIADIQRWPYVKRKWIETMQWLLDNGNKNFDSAEQFFDWWISGKSVQTYLADEVRQQKLDF